MPSPRSASSTADWKLRSFFPQARSCFFQSSAARAAACLVSCCLGLLAASAHAQITLGEEPAAEQQLVQLLNEERAAHGLPALKPNPRLLRSALQHCDRLATAGALSHQLPGEPALSERISTVGVRWSTIGENVGYAASPARLNQGWIDSPPHHKNMLSAEYTEVGIAVVRRGSLLYGVQNFARVTSEVGAQDAEQRFVHALTAMRGVGLPPMKVSSTLSLRRAMCSMAAADELDAKSLSKLKLGTHFHAFTATEPEQLPRSMQALAGDSDATEVHVGACYRATTTYPGGIYWIGVVY